jgi:hypothetical protein
MLENSRMDYLMEMEGMTTLTAKLSMVSGRKVKVMVK